MKYDELVKSLHVCINQEVEGSCRGCAYVDVPFHCSYDLMGEAADAIEELQKPRWIPVSERLPEEMMRVFIAIKRPSYTNCLSLKLSIGWYDGEYWNDSFATRYTVTHWMPLPEPPKEETDG